MLPATAGPRGAGWAQSSWKLCWAAAAPLAVPVEWAQPSQQSCLSGQWWASAALPTLVLGCVCAGNPTQLQMLGQQAAGGCVCCGRARVSLFCLGAAGNSLEVVGVWTQSSSEHSQMAAVISTASGADGGTQWQVWLLPSASPPEKTPCFTNCTSAGCVTQCSLTCSLNFRESLPKSALNSLYLLYCPTP